MRTALAFACAHCLQAGAAEVCTYMCKLPHHLGAILETVLGTVGTAVEAVLETVVKYIGTVGFFVRNLTIHLLGKKAHGSYAFYNNF